MFVRSFTRARTFTRPMIQYLHVLKSLIDLH
jgi:hypothetical protein